MKSDSPRIADWVSQTANAWLQILRRLGDQVIAEIQLRTQNARAALEFEILWAKKRKSLKKKERSQETNLKAHGILLSLEGRTWLPLTDGQQIIGEEAFWVDPAMGTIKSANRQTYMTNDTLMIGQHVYTIKFFPLYRGSKV